MKARRLEEIFEECLSAQLEGRRSVAESLSLYPSLASELEPLLRSAAEAADALGYYQPPAGLQEKVRYRYLAAVARRRAQRAAVGPAVTRWVGWRRALVAVAGSVFVVGLAVGGAALFGGGGTGNVGLGPTSSPGGSAVANLTPLIDMKRGQVEQLRRFREQGQPVDPSVLREIADTNSKIASQLADPSVGSNLDSEMKKELVSLASEEHGLLTSLAAPGPNGGTDVAVALALVEEVLTRLGASLPTGTATPRAAPTVTPTEPPTPAATPTPRPTRVPTPVPTPEPTPTETVAPTETPTETATPTELPTPTATPAPVPTRVPTPRATPTPASTTEPTLAETAAPYEAAAGATVAARP